MKSVRFWCCVLRGACVCVLPALTTELLPAWLVHVGFVPLERLLRLLRALSMMSTQPSPNSTPSDSFEKLSEYSAVGVRAESDFSEVMCRKKSHIQKYIIQNETLIWQIVFGHSFALIFTPVGTRCKYGAKPREAVRMPLTMMTQETAMYQQHADNGLIMNNKRAISL